MTMKTPTSATTAAKPGQSPTGTLKYDDKVVQKIIGIALADIKGLLTVDGGFFANLADKVVNTNDVTSGIDVEVGETQVAVDLQIVAEYGIDINQLYQRMKDVIVKQVKEMTDLDVIEVNVTVTDIKTKAEYADASVSLQDRASHLVNTAKDKVSSDDHEPNRVE